MALGALPIKLWRSGAGLSLLPYSDTQRVLGHRGSSTALPRRSSRMDLGTHPGVAWAGLPEKLVMSVLTLSLVDFACLVVTRLYRTSLPLDRRRPLRGLSGYRWQFPHARTPGRRVRAYCHLPGELSRGDMLSPKVSWCRLRLGFIGQYWGFVVLSGIQIRFQLVF